MEDSISELLETNDKNNKDKIFIYLVVIGFILLITGIGIIYYTTNNNHNYEIITHNITEVVKNKIFVDISGAIEKPGLYEFENEDIRISDVISEAGGLKNEASKEWVQKKLNLASKVKDQQKIYIPFEGEVLGNTIINNNVSGSGLININTASKEELESLPKIGSVTANKIIEYRNKKSFENIEDIMEVDGIGQSTFESIKDKIEK